ncbi:MAG: tetratricopeptide repeat protein [Deltaproteobacteria bacterium]|nr:tetratricopeptide repeat protein [Deltaproteobacteria bacterium]
MTFSVPLIFQGPALVNPVLAAGVFMETDPWDAQPSLSAIQESLKQDKPNNPAVRTLIRSIDLFDEALEKERLDEAGDRLHRLIDGLLRVIPPDRWIRATSRISAPHKIMLFGSYESSGEGERISPPQEEPRLATLPQNPGGMASALPNLAPASPAVQSERPAMGGLQGAGDFESAGDYSMRRGEIQMRLDKFEEAAVQFARAYDHYRKGELKEKMDRALEARRVALNYVAIPQEGEAARLREMIRVYTRLIRRHHQWKEPVWEAHAMVERGEAWLTLGKGELARRSFAKASALFARAGELYSAGGALERVAVALVGMERDLGEVADVFLQAGRLLEKGGYLPRAVGDYREALRIFIRLERWEEVERLAARLAAHGAENREDPEALGEAQMIRAYAFEKMGDLEMAWNLYLHAERAFVNADFIRVTAILGFLHGVCTKQGMLFKAGRVWEEARRVSKKILGESGSEPIYFAMGKALLSMGVFGEALPLLWKALGPPRRGDLFRAMVYEALGEAHLELGDGEEAESSFARAFQLYTLAKDEEGVQRVAESMVQLREG